MEDTSPQFSGCHGIPAAKTPNMDRLAARGIRFALSRMSPFKGGTYDTRCSAEVTLYLLDKRELSSINEWTFVGNN